LNNTSNEITQENQVADDDGNRNGTIKKRKSEVFLVKILLIKIFDFIFS
jgi:hypothetical protein